MCRNNFMNINYHCTYQTHRQFIIHHSNVFIRTFNKANGVLTWHIRLLWASTALFQNSKNCRHSVFWDVTPCRSCVNRRFGGTYRLNLQGNLLNVSMTSLPTEEHYVNFDVFTTVTMKIAVLWGAALCISCVKRRFGGTSQSTAFL
jgi:hypothetical protein